MNLVCMLQIYKDKINKETNNNDLRHMQNPGTPEDHRSIASHFNIINKRVKRSPNKGKLDFDKQTQVMNNHYKKKL